MLGVLRQYEQNRKNPHMRPSVSDLPPFDGAHLGCQNTTIIHQQLHSRPQSLRSFWPVVGIETSGRTRFSEHAQSICFEFSTNQIC